MISRTGLHALKALAVLAALPAGRCAGAAAVARQIGSPPNYLGKLLQKLGSHGLVESVKGLGGGFRLARSASSIRLMDVIDPFDHVSRWSGCFLGRPVCSDGAPCPVHVRWARARTSYLDLLGTTTIADLVRAPGRKSPPPQQGGSRSKSKTAGKKRSKKGGSEHVRH